MMSDAFRSFKSAYDQIIEDIETKPLPPPTPRQLLEVKQLADFLSHGTQQSNLTLLANMFGTIIDPDVDEEIKTLLKAALHEMLNDNASSAIFYAACLFAKMSAYNFRYFSEKMAEKKAEEAKR